ncbi:radical SAM protein [Candidatus Pacearchaeota archaeon]|nr:radical SAM protein [Candidatus Pacearchaeota archaeon]
MIDLLLINPSSITVQNNPIPFGLAYMASYLEKNGYSVRILDLSVKKMSEEQIIQLIKESEPKNIGISCMSVHINLIKSLTKKIKENFKGIRILIGGIHPTALPEKSIRELKDADVFVVGEGERAILELMQNKKLEKIKGIAYLKKNKIVINKPREFIENLDELPFPARQLLPDMKNYSLSFDWEGRKPDATIFSSRGCPYNCIYCASKVMWKQRVRFRSAENVLEEIDLLVNKYKVKEILFYDDHFLLNKNRLVKICEELIKRRYDLTWCCLSRVDSIEFETLKLMKKAGCHMISFGVESGSQKVLDSMEKNVKVESIIKAFDICKKAGMNTKASFIFGAPGEDYESIRETQKVIKRILPDYIWLFIMTPMPGTKLYKLHEETGIVSDEWGMYDQTTYNKFYGTKLSYEELRKAVAETYKRYYLSPKYILSQIKKLSFRKIKVYFTLLRKVVYVMNYINRGREK